MPNKKKKSFFRGFKHSAEASLKVTKLTDNKNKITIEQSESSVKHEISFTIAEMYPFDQEIDQDIQCEIVVGNDKLTSLPRLPEQED